MSVFKSQYSRALSVFKSDDANIPFPQVIASGTGSRPAPFQVSDSTKNFIELNVSAGDIIYNNMTNTSATVVEVINENTLLLNAFIFSIPPAPYTLYAASAQNTIGNTGCFLYVGGTGSLSVTTVGGDDVVFDSVPAGEVLPVQVIKVKSSSTATGLVALW